MKRITDFDSINIGLANVKEALARISDPQNSFKAIQVAGTNGKGSVSSFLEVMFLEKKASKKLLTAKFTSPHLLSVTERISIQGRNVSASYFKALHQELFGIAFEEDVIDLSFNELELGFKEKTYERVYSKPLLSELALGFKLSYFERLAVLAFEYFKRQGVDLAILEVGLGGRFDATNIISPEHTLATVITSIGLDHQEYLGNTLEEIRTEKEAIIKDRVPHFDYLDIEDAAARHSLSADLNSRNGINFLLAKDVFETLNKVSLSEIEIDDVFRSFEKRWKGRYDYDAQKRILIDGAHNPDAAKKLNEYINAEIKPSRRIFVVAFLDKDVDSFINELALKANDILIITELDMKRAFKKENLKIANKILADDLASALEKAKDLRSDNDLLIITGSLYLIGNFYKKKS